ncbi:MAG: hypothetical protein KJ749_10200 [Planctomycetes bacterium]|nr:hypothetical protein [Planctomycetota bacterium]
MMAFVQRHAGSVIGVLNGFDRLRLRGTKRLLAHVGGMMNFLWQERVPLKEFGAYAAAATDRIRRATERMAEAAGQAVRYVSSSLVSKEDLVRRIVEEREIRDGLICILSCVEPCRSYEIHRNRHKREIELQGGWRKCLHYYHYYHHPKLGLLHVRLQTWFPFNVHVCLNGREWLARQMDAAGIGYVRRDNCFVDIADVPRAQALMDRQLKTDWPRLLDGLLTRVNPVERDLFRRTPVPYYWSVDQSEWATDVMFKSPEALAALYPRLLRHGMQNLSSVDVMRFLGRRVPAHNGRYGTFKGEVVSDLRERPEGIRVKHRLNRNSIKMYDKQASVLRVETTINDARDMKVYRPKEGQARGPKQWRYMRKGVADVHRRAQVSQRANERYLDSLAAVESGTALGELTERLCRPVAWKGKRVRALNPLSMEDARLLEMVNRGEFALHGFRNRDLRTMWYGPKPAEKQEIRRQSAAITRKLRMLRAHGVIQKVQKTHRYVLTRQGTTSITALLSARAADTAKLLSAA